MKVYELVNVLNRDLKVLDNTKITSVNQLHDLIRSSIKKSFKELKINIFEVNIWRVLLASNMSYDILRYDIDFKKDKRCEYAFKGVLNNAYVTMVGDIGDLDVEWLEEYYLSKRKEEELKGLKKYILDLEEELREAKEELKKYE